MRNKKIPISDVKSYSNQLKWFDIANNLILPSSSYSMNITLILDYSDKRSIGGGGPQGVAYDTVEGLKKNHRRLEQEDIHFHIVSTTGTTVHSVYEKDDTYRNISYEYFRAIVPTAISGDINYLLHIKKWREKIDVLHSHILPGAFVGTLLKIPTVLTLHGMLWKIGRAHV